MRDESSDRIDSMCASLDITPTVELCTQLKRFAVEYCESINTVCNYIESALWSCTPSIEDIAESLREFAQKIECDKECEPEDERREYPTIPISDAKPAISDREQSVTPRARSRLRHTRPRPHRKHKCD